MAELAVSEYVLEFQPLDYQLRINIDSLYSFPITRKKTAMSVPKSHPAIVGMSL